MTSGETLRERVRAIAATHEGRRGPLLPILHDLQEEFGYLDAEAITVVADVLNLSRAEVYGVVSFYADFTEVPRGARTVRVCRAEACRAVGSEELAEHATRRLGVAFGQTAPDRSVTLEQVFCLGNCALGPSVQVDGRLHGRVDAARFDSLVAGS
ncbi:MAG TPA: NAD(P)H-dependent oxidoreductase subunit E [Pseudonocardiaceae bacterium]